jgi:hypothetical protein
MKGEILKILFKSDLAFLTEEVALDLNQVQISDMPVKFQASAFWTIRVINYIENENRLFVEVLSYEIGETEFPDNQIELADILISVEKVTFKSIDTSALLRTLNGKEPVRISPPKQETVYRRETSIQPETRIVREPIKQTYSESFSVSIKNITFLSGKVVFEKKMEQFKRPIKFQISNASIIEEYDAIKNYFSNVLKTKKIHVVSTITTVDDVIDSINATSVEIEKIDSTFIEEVKFEIVKGARKKEPPEDKQLFTMDEYLETFVDENPKTPQLFKDEKDFFDTVLEKSRTKHYKHLRYLSSKHKHDLIKLRFVHKPFSFVFLLGGIDKFHIVWETLDTQEATYIWSVTNDIKNLRQVLIDADKTINLILRDGKNEFIGRNEKNFNRVFHDYTDLQNGFKNWKEAIEKVIL